MMAISTLDAAHAPRLTVWVVASTASDGASAPSTVDPMQISSDRVRIARRPRRSAHAPSTMASNPPSAHCRERVALRRRPRPELVRRERHGLRQQRAVVADDEGQGRKQAEHARRPGVRSLWRVPPRQSAGRALQRRPEHRVHQERPRPPRQPEVDRLHDPHGFVCRPAGASGLRGSRHVGWRGSRPTRARPRAPDRRHRPPPSRPHWPVGGRVLPRARRPRPCARTARRVPPAARTCAGGPADRCRRSRRNPSRGRALHRRRRPVAPAAVRRGRCRRSG